MYLSDSITITLGTFSITVSFFSFISSVIFLKMIGTSTMKQPSDSLTYYSSLENLRPSMLTVCRSCNIWCLCMALWGLIIRTVTMGSEADHSWHGAWGRVLPGVVSSLSCSLKTIRTVFFQRLQIPPLRRYLLSNYFFIYYSFSPKYDKTADVTCHLLQWRVLAKTPLSVSQAA